jgi:O-antigen/teichoic acid export membrane protein
MIMSASSVLGAKGINLLVMFVSVPLTYSYLGEERFGLLMLILSLVMLMSFADLGLGYGLLNKIAVYDVAKDVRSMRQAVSSTFFFLLATGVFILIVFALVYPYIEWSELFNVKSSEAQSEAGTAVFVFAVCFCLALPFTIVTKLQAGYQENHINQIWEASGNVFSLIALIVAVHFRVGVPLILLALYGSQCAFILFNFLTQFLVRRRHLLPSVFAWNFPIFKDVFREAAMICVLQISSILINAIDSILIARFIGPIAVGAYAIGYRLFSVFILPVQALLSSILPAFNDAVANDDVGWILRGMKKSTGSVIGFSIALGCLFVLLANFIIDIWISPDAQLGWPLIIAFSAYVVYQNISSLLFNIMLSPIFLKQLFVMYSIAAVLIISLKVLFINFFHYSSVLWATMIGATLVFLWPGYVKVFGKLKEMRVHVESRRTLEGSRVP